MIKSFINRPVLSTVISILIVILGVLGILSLPVSQYPDIAPVTVSVRASYGGANAETVLKAVVIPLEEQINGVENMDYIVSSASNSGSANITVYFKNGMDPDNAAVLVQNRVSYANAILPAEVKQAGVTVEKREAGILGELLGDQCDSRTQAYHRGRRCRGVRREKLLYAYMAGPSEASGI